MASNSNMQRTNTLVPAYSEFGYNEHISFHQTSLIASS